MNARFWKIGCGCFIAMILAMGALVVVIWLCPGALFLTDRTMKGTKFRLRGRLMMLASDSGVLNDTSRQKYGAARFQTFVATKNNAVEDFWVRGKKHSVRYTLNPNLDSWTSTSNIGWIVQASVSCATNLMFKVYSNLDILPIPLEEGTIGCWKEYERFLLGVGGVYAFETECDQMFKENCIPGNQSADILPSLRFAANGAQTVRFEKIDDDQSILIIYLDADEPSGFIVSQTVDSRVHMPGRLRSMKIVRLEDRIWWFSKTMIFPKADEAYFILHGK